MAKRPMEMISAGKTYRKSSTKTSTHDDNVLYIGDGHSAGISVTGAAVRKDDINYFLLFRIYQNSKKKHCMIV